MHAQVRPLLEAMGRGVIELGDDPAAAAAAKLVGNFMIISQVVSSAGVCRASPQICHALQALDALCFWRCI